MLKQSPWQNLNREFLAVETSDVMAEYIVFIMNNGENLLNLLQNIVNCIRGFRDSGDSVTLISKIN